MKQRLINAQALRDEWLENGENEHIYDTNDFLNSIDDQPTVDAEPVVRCVNCGYCHTAKVADTYQYVCVRPARMVEQSSAEDTDPYVTRLKHHKELVNADHYCRYSTLKAGAL